MNEGKKQILFETLDDLYAWYRQLVKGMTQSPEVFKAFVNVLLEDAVTDEEKIKIIYYWVQDNVRYVAYEDGIAGFQPKPSEDVYLKRYGDCKGMANLTKEMLVIAGFDARLTWLGTNSVPYNYDIHSLASDNHMICTLIWKGKKYFLDPTEKYAAFGENAERIQGRQVMIEDGDEYIIETIPLSNVSDNRISRSYKLNLKDQQLVGDVELTYTGEGKRIYLNSINNLKSEYKDRAIDNLVSNNDGDIYPYDVSSSDISNREQDIKLTAKLDINNKVISGGKEEFVLLDLIKEDKFSSKIDSTRKFGYDFKLKLTYDVSFQLVYPKNRSASNLPSSFKVENESFVYDFSFVKKGNMIIITKTVTLLKPVLSPSDITEWNSAISQLDDQLNKAFVLN